MCSGEKQDLALFERKNGSSVQSQGKSATLNLFIECSQVLYASRKNLQYEFEGEN